MAPLPEGNVGTMWRSPEVDPTMSAFGGTLIFRVALKGDRIFEDACDVLPIGERYRLRLILESKGERCRDGGFRQQQTKQDRIGMARMCQARTMEVLEGCLSMER